MSDEATTVTGSGYSSSSGVESEASEDLISQNNVQDLRDRENRKRKRYSSYGKASKASASKGNAKIITKTSGTPEADDNEDVLEQLPDYLRKRREAFNRRRHKLREIGLRLPPTYEDIDFSDDDDLERLEEKPELPNVKPIAAYKDISLPLSLGVVPASLTQRLREYQVSGAAFLHKLFVYQNGGILGDDMGLGKTIQVITFLTAAFGKTGDERDIKRMRKMRQVGADWYPLVLVICPGGLLGNWQAEFKRWGFWHVDVYHGDSKESAFQAAKAGRIEIMLTTYATYRLDKDLINMIEWDCVIADEFHVIKGRHSSTTAAMNEINALCRIGLTGTAIQNSYDELWTLLNWTNPGVFGPSSDWKQAISNPLRQGQSHTATLQELGEARKVAKQLTENLLPRFFLRRMKSLIAHQLPRKTDRVVFCPLTSKQADAYEKFLDSEIIEAIKSSSDACDCGTGKRRGRCCGSVIRNQKWQNFVFPAIATLQKIANHLAMLIPHDGDPEEKQKRDLELLRDALPDEWREINRTKSWVTHLANSDFCGKWKVLKKLLRFWHEHGDKVLVFSHSVRLLRMLRILFQNTAYNVSLLDGSMSLSERGKEVERFNAEPGQFVFLISTKAGGVGLNITSANKVVIFDPNWNPSYDLQAQDRAYRIGQVRDVEVFRLVSAGTIEEIVYARQIYKQQQANIGYTASKERRYFTGIQADKNQKGEIFGLANLFAYQGESLVLRDIVNKTNVAESRVGVSIADFDASQAENDKDGPFSSQSDSEDGAMSQLANMVKKGKTSLDAAAKSQKHSSKTDPIQAILAQAGVEYTHENSEVIGTSRVESKLSRKAEAAAAAAAAPAKQGEMVRMEMAFHEFQTRPEAHHARGGAPADLSGFKWRYNPPNAVMKRQFCSMARAFGFDSPTEFALVVEGWTQAQRRNCLDEFYAKRREALGGQSTEAGLLEEGVIIDKEEIAAQGNDAGSVMRTEDRWTL